MSKSILTVPTSKYCVECVLCYRKDLDNFICQPKGNKVLAVGVIPSWCPLRPMPEPEKLKSYPSKWERGYVVGFNECLKQIGGRDE